MSSVFDPSASGINVESLAAGSGDWRNIQDVLRVSIRQLYHGLQAQHSMIQELRQTVATQSQVDAIETQVRQRVTQSDFLSTIQQVETRILSESAARTESAAIVRASLQKLETELQSHRGLLDSHTADIGARPTSEELRSALEERALVVDVNEALSQKANKQSVITALHRKANKAEVDARFAAKADAADVNACLVGKADVSTVNAALELRPLRADVTSYVDGKVAELRTYAQAIAADSCKPATLALEELRTRLSAQAADAEQAVAELAEGVAALRTRASEAENAISSLHEAAASAAATAEAAVAHSEFSSWVHETENSLADFVQATQSNLNSRDQALSSSIERFFSEQTAAVRASRDQASESRAADSRRVSDALTDLDARINAISTTQRSVDESVAGLRADVLQVRSRAVDPDDLSGRVAALRAETHAAIASTAQRCSDLATSAHQELSAALQEAQHSFNRELASVRASTDDALSSGLTRVESAVAIGSKSAKSDTGKIHSAISQLRDELGDLRATLETCATAAEITEVQGCITALDGNKASVSDVCALLDTKAGIEDVNRSLAEISLELDSKAPLAALRAALDRQQAVNDAISLDHAVGRWLWKSGHVKPSGAVPWNVESANSSPDNFVWRKDASAITVAAPGLYSVNFGFFGRKRPTVQLLVNGDPVLSAVNAAGNVVYHPPRSKVLGTVTGQTLSEFLALPAGSKVQLVVTGFDSTTQAFLSLQKL
jgi:hypothetical protein